MSDSKKKWAWGIVASSVVMIIAYDGYLVWKHRPIPCAVGDFSCPNGRICIRPDADQKGRCLPIAHPPSMTFSLPFEERTPVQCVAGNNDGKIHTTDFDIFNLSLQPQLKRAVVVAAADGEAIVLKDEVRVIHANGYVSSYRPLREILTSDGPVRSGQILGETENALEFGLHYLNSKSDPEMLRAAPTAGFSVPFVMRHRTKANETQFREFHSQGFSCGSEAPFIYR